MLHITQLDHVLITIPLNTRLEAKDFYTRKLRLEEIPGNHPKGAIWIQMGNIELHIREDEAHQTNSARHPAFEVDNLEISIAFLKSLNIEITFSSVIEGRERCFFRDPWGNRFELIEYHQ